MNKATKVEHEKRIEATRLMLLRGDDSTRIVQNLAGTLNIKERQAFNYLRLARERIKLESQPMRDYLLAEHIAARRLVRQRAIDAGDLRNALAAMRDEAELMGLYPSAKNTNLNLNLDELTDEQLQRIAAGDDPAQVVANSRATASRSRAETATAPADAIGE